LSDFLIFVTSRQPSSLFPAMKKNPQTQNIFELPNTSKDRNSTLYNAKHGAFLNSVSLRKLVLVNVRIIGRAGVKN
jgi:hypothetical protein